VGTPGSHGAVVAGTHGIGVKTPNAAAVAAATVGLAKLLHMPNGGMLTIGMWSMTLAACMPPAVTRLTGSTCNDAGAAPKLHRSIAPLATCNAISPPIVEDYSAYFGHRKEICQAHSEGDPTLSDNYIGGGGPMEQFIWIVSYIIIIDTF
jgi:hypothetical protein